MNLINDMLTLAAVAHNGQFDKAGVPYIFHIMAVTEYTRQRWGHEDEELLCIAAGHDLIEDTDVDYQFLLEEFGERIADGILDLSKIGGNFDPHAYEKYQYKVLSNLDAMKVKVCDLRHNMQPNRILMDAKTEQRMDKYAKFRDLIEDKLNEVSLP